MAREIIASITDRGQITLPAEIRRLLKLKGRDKVAFRVEGEQITLRAALTVDSGYGSVAPPQEGIDPDDQIRKAKEEKAIREAEKLSGR